MNIEKDVKFGWVNKYVHSYYVPGLHDKLKEYQGIFDREFNHGKREEHAANAYILNENFDNDFQYLFWKIIDHFYMVDPPWRKSNFGVYKQSKDENVSVYHNHITTSIINAVTYLNPPKTGEGGGLSIWDPPYDEFELQPEENVVYTFPGWILHKPLPQSVDTPRYSINWGVDSNKRPIHKFTGERW
jgi:hypothetical protein